MAGFRDRVKELRRVRAGELVPHPLNWRSHPEAQRKALVGILGEVGIADALLVRELEDGRYQLIDGHLRAAMTADQVVPVLVLDLSAAEADKLLATLDPLAGLAGVDKEKLDALVADLQFESEALRDLVGSIGGDAASTVGTPPEARWSEACQVIVECSDELQQQELYERLTAEGFRCKVCAF